MSRVQLAINVSDLSAAIEFYSKLFGAEPAKSRPGYANFALDDPPLKLVLIEDDRGGTLNHLGVEVSSRDEVPTGRRGRCTVLGDAPTMGEEMAGQACC
jgi:catechol 2,3-dioxygenase-like lactoylglutathione lyase family enzyme